MLTARGWWLLSSAIALVVSGALIGIQELYALALAAAVLLLACATWVHGRQWELTTSRDLHPARIAAGGMARVELMVRNELRQRSPVVAAVDPFDALGRSASFLVAPLAPGQAERAAYRLPTTRRGVYKLGPLKLTVSDPFGLVSMTRTAAAASTLTVHPKVERVRVPPARTGADRRHGDGRPVLGVQGDEFFALREYRTGDDLRRVHWTATARTGELMIRQDEVAHRGQVTVAVDLRAEVWRPAALETALSGAASVAVASAAAGLDVRLVHTGGLDTGYLPPSRQATVLDGLATASVHRGGGETLPSQFRRYGPSTDGATLVVFTSDAVTDQDLTAVARLAGHRGAVSLVVVGRTEGCRAPAPAVGRSDVSVVWVEAGGSFASAWDRALGAGRGVPSDA